MKIETVLKIGQKDITDIISTYEVAYEQSFAGDYRNMNGALRTTYVATIPTISVSTIFVRQEAIRELLDLLNEPVITIGWWDEQEEELREGDFYRSELTTELKSTVDGVYEGLEFELTGYEPLDNL